jgi:beta-1,4-N-acetylglucosaminyltransferase
MLKQRDDIQIKAKKRIIFCFGEGGHTAQANRLFAQLKPFLEDAEIFTIGDFHEKPLWSDSHYYYPPLRDKIKGFTLSAFLNAAKSLKSMLGLISASTTNGVISTGPGFCVLICAIARLFRKNTVHIETWSRFETQSLTGKLSYLVCKRFYVQNKEQLNFYKKAIYCGLL